MESRNHTNIQTQARRVIAVANQKGGVGKTTTAVNLAIGLANAGRRTLLIDMDPQGNATFAVLGPEEPSVTTYDLLVGNYSPEDVIVSSKYDGLDVLPTDIDLAGAEVELLPAVGGQTRLRTRLRGPALERYDFVIIDTPPSLGLLTINSLSAAGEVLIPVSASVFALKGISQLEKTLGQVQTDLEHPTLHISGVLCTMFDNTNVARDVVQTIRDRFGPVAFQAVIPKNIKIEEAHSRAESVYAYAPESRGAEAYGAFVREVLERKEVAVYG